MRKLKKKNRKPTKNYKAIFFNNVQFKLKTIGKPSFQPILPRSTSRKKNQTPEKSLNKSSRYQDYSHDSKMISKNAISSCFDKDSSSYFGFQEGEHSDKIVQHYYVDSSSKSRNFNNRPRRYQTARPDHMLTKIVKDKRQPLTLRQQFKSSKTPNLEISKLVSQVVDRRKRGSVLNNNQLQRCNTTRQKLRNVSKNSKDQNLSYTSEQMKTYSMPKIGKSLIECSDLDSMISNNRGNLSKESLESGDQQKNTLMFMRKKVVNRKNQNEKREKSKNKTNTLKPSQFAKLQMKGLIQENKNPRESMFSLRSHINFNIHHHQDRSLEELEAKSSYLLDKQKSRVEIRKLSNPVVAQKKVLKKQKSAIMGNQVFQTGPYTKFRNNFDILESKHKNF